MVCIHPSAVYHLHLNSISIYSKFPELASQTELLEVQFDFLRVLITIRFVHSLPYL